MQSVKTRAALLTRLNARTEVFVAKLEDEFRVAVLFPGEPKDPDPDLRTPVIPGIYLLDLSLIFRTPASIASTNGISIAFTGPLGITDGGYGALTQLGTPQRNSPGTGLLTVQNFLTAATLVNQNLYINRSGWFAVREAGDLVLTWNSIIVGGAGTTLIRGSSIHLVRAINDGDPA